MQQRRFFEGYCEPIEGFYAHTSDLLEKAVLFDDFKKDDPTVGDPTEVDEEFEVEPVGMRLLFDGSWRIEWAYRSLLDALSIMFIFNASAKSPEVKICAECEQPYIAQRPHAKYCSESHSARSRKRRQRERERTKKSSK